MNSKTYKYISAILLGLLLFLVLGYWALAKRYQELEGSSSTTKSDTVYVNNFFTPKPSLKSSFSLKSVEIPSLVLFYQTKIDSISKIEYKRDTVKIQTFSGLSLDIHPSFLTQYPTTERLIQLDLGSNRLSLVTQNTLGQVQERKYAINPQKFSYRWVDNQLTSKRNYSSLFKLNFIASAQYRPLNKLWDFNFGVGHNTSKFHYEIGLNTFYYPSLKKGLGSDIYLRIAYIF